MYFQLTNVYVEYLLFVVRVSILCSSAFLGLRFIYETKSQKMVRFSLATAPTFSSGIELVFA